MKDGGWGVGVCMVLEKGGDGEWGSYKVRWMCHRVVNKMQSIQPRRKKVFQ